MRLQLTLHGRDELVFEGDPERVRAFAAKVRDAMTKRVDTILTHDFDLEPKSFLCSEIANVSEIEE